MKNILLIFFTIFFLKADAQRNRIKLGLMGVPMFQSGFGMGNIGFERLNKTLNSSWQIHFSFAGGSPAADAETTNRKWLTLEKSIYLKRNSGKFNFYYSFFNETGKRTERPGFSHFEPDSILQRTTTFEINPGAGIGTQFQLMKKFKMEVQAGPKLIIANGKKYYYNSLAKQEFSELINKLRGGFRFFACIYYQF